MRFEHDEQSALVRRRSGKRGYDFRRVVRVVGVDFGIHRSPYPLHSALYAREFFKTACYRAQRFALGQSDSRCGERVKSVVFSADFEFDFA